MKIQKIKKILKNIILNFCTSSSRGNQVEGLPLALNTEGISVGGIRMLSQPVTRTEGISVRVMTRTEGISLGVIRMLSDSYRR